MIDDRIAKAHSIGLNSVPTYILNNRHAVVGAQPYEAFQRLLEEINSEENSNE